MSSDVESYYDRFSKRLVRDLIYGNERIQQQLEFLSRAIPADTKSVLVIGSGSGQAVHFIASKVAPNAKVLAVDISANNLELGKTLFSHQNVEYRKIDITRDEVNGQWEVIVLPDVYEHIPRPVRDKVHAALDKLLSTNGRILLTLPTPGKQRALVEGGEGLQIVDEIVTLEDLAGLAASVHATLTYFNMISVYDTNDYIHSVIERHAESIRKITKNDMVPLKGWPKRNLIRRGLSFVNGRAHLNVLLEKWRKMNIHKRLAQNSKP